MMDHLCQEQQRQQLQQHTHQHHSRCHEWCRFILDFLLFYTTAFFVLLAVFSLFALVFLVPFFIDPAWSTLQADFDPLGTQCQTISGQYLEGRSFCDWSSCQEGCTKTVYTCWKIIVEYQLPGVNPGETVKPPTATGKLFPNVKGCGYPPSVDCHNFLKIYGANGTNFTCFVARTNPELVIVNLDLHEVKSHLFYSLAVPFPCLFISLCYLVIAYKYIYNDKPEQNDAFKPVTSATAPGTALAAFVDLKDSEDQDVEKERQRKFLLQIQRTKWLAQHGKLDKAGVTGTTEGSSGTVDLSKCVRIKELEESKADKIESEPSKGPSEPYDERMKKDRSSYNAEKHKILNYYNYYNVNG